MSACHWHEEDLILSIRVQPRASREKIVGIVEGTIKIALTAPPVEGAANGALKRLLAKLLNVSQGAIQIIQGEHARNKVIRIHGIKRSDADRFLQHIGLPAS